MLGGGSAVLLDGSQRTTVPRSASGTSSRCPCTINVTCRFRIFTEITRPSPVGVLQRCPSFGSVLRISL